MTIEACVALAIHEDLDILEALPEVQTVPLEELESYVRRYVDSLNEKLCDAVESKKDLLDAENAPGLTLYLMSKGLDLPPPILSAMSRSIIDLYHLNVTELDPLKTGEPVYEVKMTVDVKDILEGGRLGV